MQNTFALVNNYDGKSPLVCGWAPDGLSFGIFCSEQHFATTFKAGGYFKHEKYRSFVRQLNHYGFRKLRDDELPVHSIAGNYYQHENFMKGREDLLKFISAKINKGETEERSQLRQRIITLERNMQYFLQVLSPQQRTAFQALCGPIGELKCEGTAFDVDEEESADMPPPPLALLPPPPLPAEDVDADDGVLREVLSSEGLKTTRVR